MAARHSAVKEALLVGAGWLSAAFVAAHVLNWVTHNWQIAVIPYFVAVAIWALYLVATTVTRRRDRPGKEGDPA